MPASIPALVRRLALPAILLAALIPSSAHAWSHQGHMLLSRLAALRIMDDPTAPAELKTFLRANMPYTLAACQQLAISDHIGANPSGPFTTGLDGAATYPDRVQQMENGKALIAPYKVDEGKLHYLDLEFFSSAGVYRDDLSGLPKLADIPHDLNDPRYKQAGFVHFRLDECYNNLVASLRKSSEPNNPDALKWLGYTVHYAQDIHQPQHSTVDFKSLSYLAAAKVPGVRTITRDLADGRTIQQHQVDRDKSRLINPHGDIEFQLFEKSDGTHAGYRRLYWSLLQDQLDSQHQNPPATLAQAHHKPIYHTALAVLMDSYRNLPQIGRAAQAAYKTGQFNPDEFFLFKENPESPTILNLIAQQNARAVLLSETLIRRAWAESHAK